jgi:ethanolamine ammonia-lyase large subunit
MSYRNIVANQQYHFADLKTLMAKAIPLRSGDELAGVAARDATEHVAAQMTLADVPLKTFLNEVVIDYETDEITRLIIDEHDLAAFTPISHFTVGDFRNWLLGEDATAESLKALASGLTPEMVAAVSKIMRNQDLIYVASKCEVVTQFRNTIGLKGHLSTRLQPNHPTDDVLGISASILDGLMYGNGDAVIGINPATDNLHNLSELLKLLDHVIQNIKFQRNLVYLRISAQAFNLLKKCTD